MGRHYDDQRDVVLELDAFTCQACGEDERIKVHHVVPRSSGGKDVVGNLVTLCAHCEKAVHAEHVWPGFLQRDRRTISPETVYNVMLLREIRIFGRGSAKADTVRDNYFRRRLKPRPGRLNPYDLSPASLNVAYVLESGAVDDEQRPMTLSCGDLEVSVRRKETSNV